MQEKFLLADAKTEMKRTPDCQEFFFKLPSGLEPPTSSLPRMRATDCAKVACRVLFHTQKLIYTMVYRIVKS